MYRIINVVIVKAKGAISALSAASEKIVDESSIINPA